MTPFIDDPDFTLHLGDVQEVLRQLPGESVQTCVTSPPYWSQRDYGMEGQLGMEPTAAEYVNRMVDVFSDVKRVLRNDGTLWLNIGDSYGKDKNLLLIPARLAMGLQADGWILRSEIIWHKPNAMPESIHDRPTCAHEHVWLLAKNKTYFYDKEAVKEEAEWARWGKQTNPKYDGTVTKGGFIKERSKRAIYAYMNGTGEQEGLTKNLRNVWTITTEPYEGAHFATFPQELVEPCIKAGSAEGDTVLDPFMGSGTTALVARKLGRKAIGIELNEEYAALCAHRTNQQSLLA